jgi:hypothetical protein
MEEALKYELETNITDLSGNIYPTNAPETADKPYLVYKRINTKKIKTLQGFTGKQDLSFMFSVMAKRYEDMITLRKEVETLLISMLQTNIGEDDSIYVEDIDINNIDEQYEYELKMNRGIIDFTIYY